MALTVTRTEPVSATARWLHGLWQYYKGYTHSAVHTASAAALTVFGLLVFIDGLFAVLAIASYVLPPILLYSIDADVGKSSDGTTETSVRTESGMNASGGPGADPDGTDADTDGDDGDTDSDGDDGDTDSDG